MSELAADANSAAAEAVAAKYPTSSYAWATLADERARGGRAGHAYAYARTGYHRGLDALRRNGWKGHGPVPWSHEPNRGFLRCLHASEQGGRRDRRGRGGARCAHSCATPIRPPPIN